MQQALLDQQAGAGGDHGHPGPEGDLELDAHGDQLAARDAAEEGGLGVGERAGGVQAPHGFKERAIHRALT